MCDITNLEGCGDTIHSFWTSRVLAGRFVVSYRDLSVLYIITHCFCRQS
jgi:hypothetical protein